MKSPLRIFSRDYNAIFHIQKFKEQLKTNPLLWQKTTQLKFTYGERPHNINTVKRATF